MGKPDLNRYKQFGKCCWTCEKEDCHFYQNSPFESSEGRDCTSYRSTFYMERAEFVWKENCPATPVPDTLKEGRLLIISWHWTHPDGVGTSRAVVQSITSKRFYQVDLKNWQSIEKNSVAEWIEVPIT
jgi:hypothetical protein